jgi:hypothetical protein
VVGKSDAISHPTSRHRAGIEKKIGWHSFRQTYTTLLHSNGEDVKVVQELLRRGSATFILGVRNMTDDIDCCPHALDERRLLSLDRGNWILCSARSFRKR